MTKITSKSNLNAGTEFSVTLGSAVTLTEAGNLTEADGVTGKSLFSALSDWWKSGTNANKYRFPFAQGVGELATLLEFRGGYTIASGDETFIRDSGVRYTSDFAGATVAKEYCCLVHSGAIGGSEQPYVLKATDTAPTNLNFTGSFNELVQIYDSAGDDDTGSLAIFVRTQGKTYGYYDLTTEQALSSILPVSYLIPMTTETDTHGSDTGGAVRSDAYIAANTPYTGMGGTGDGSDLYTTITGTGFTAWANSTVYAANAVVSSAGRWYITTAGGTSSGTSVADDTGVTDWASYDGERDVDGTYYAFNKIIDGNSGTKEQIWEFHQYMLRQTSDVDSSGTTQRGDTCPALLSWDGDTLVTGTGVFVDNVLTAEESEYEFTDVGGTARTIAFVPSFTINCVDSSGSSTNFATGTRVRIYDETNTTELYNNTPGATDTVSVNFTAGGSATLRYKIISVNGATGATKMINATAAISSANVAVNVTQETDQVYVDNNIDGSAVTGISIDSGKIDIDINDTDNTVSVQQIYAWYVYYNASSGGIADSNFLITANTQTDYTFDDTVEVQNTKTGYPLTITGANVTDASGSVTGWIDTTGENIYVIPASVVPFQYSTGSGLSSAQDTKLTSIYDTVGTLPDADAIHDEVVENSVTFRQMMRIIFAVLTGKASGAATTTVTFRDNADTKDRVSATVDADGNRTAVTLDGS